VIGPRGSGKTTQARFLAQKLDLFHFKFREYLQELIIGKTKRIIEPEKEEDKEPEKEEEKTEEEEEEEAEKEAKEDLPQLTEKEEIIKAYLEKDESLPVNIIDEVLRPLWTEEPFKYTF
jgi:shikimate kinase